MMLVYLGSAWLLGVYVGSLVRWPAYGLVAAACLPLGFAVAARRRPRIALAALCLALATLGAARLAAVRPTLAANDIATRNDGEPLAFRGTVAAYPDARGTYTNLNVQVTETRTGGGWEPATGHVLVRTAPYPAFDYGDRLEVWGKPETPPVFPDFSYKDYLARKGIRSLVRYARVSKWGSGAGQPLFTLLYGIRSRAQQVIAQILPEPQAALLTGILLGLEAGIPRDLMADFNATGTTHIIVISGFNITIIAGLFLALGRRTLGRKWATYVTVAGIAVYTVLVGADAAVVRAAFMGVLYVWSLHLGRQTEAVTSLVFASFLMTLLNPWTLWDLGFQLSFLATLSLIRFTPALQARFEASLDRLWHRPVPPPLLALLNDALIVTLAAQIMATPLIVAVFGRLSLVSLLTNFLILPDPTSGDDLRRIGHDWRPDRVAAWPAPGLVPLADADLHDSPGRVDGAHSSRQLGRRAIQRSVVAAVLRAAAGRAGVVSTAAGRRPRFTGAPAGLATSALETTIRAGGPGLGRDSQLEHGH